MYNSPNTVAFVDYENVAKNVAPLDGYCYHNDVIRTQAGRLYCRGCSKHVTPRGCIETLDGMLLHAPSMAAGTGNPYPEWYVIAIKMAYEDRYMRDLVQYVSDCRAMFE